VPLNKPTNKIVIGIPAAKTEKTVPFEGVIFSGGWSSEGFDEELPILNFPIISSNYSLNIAKKIFSFLVR
jgi:hypothetical protein